MKSLHAADWITETLRTAPPRAKSLLTTVFGDAVAPHGGSIWLGSLIDLMAPFGFDARSVRTSIFRLVQDGWLTSARFGRQSSYSITEQAWGRFEKAYKRVYAPLEPVWDGYWTLLFAAPTDIAPTERIRFRKALAWDGFGMVCPGVYAHPTIAEEEIEDLLRHFHLQERLVVLRAQEAPTCGGKPLGSVVNETWALAQVSEGYVEFIERFASLAQSIASIEITPKQAFAIRILLVHEFRRVQLHDPKLPSTFLPKNWSGYVSYALCKDIYRQTYVASERYFLDTLLGKGHSVTVAAPDFYQRFGGLG